MSNFSFSHSVFKRLVMQTYKNQGLFGKGLKTLTKRLLKTLWEKEKMLVTSIFSFPHNVFYSSEDKFQSFSHIYNVFCKSSQIWQVVNFLICEPFPKRHILVTSKLKEFADDDFEFDENGWKFSCWLENTVGKGEIARYEQFLLFPRCFQKTCYADT